jgi:hypothetical protein
LAEGGVAHERLVESVLVGADQAAGVAVRFVA